MTDSGRRNRSTIGAPAAINLHHLAFGGAPVKPKAGAPRANCGEGFSANPGGQ